MKEQTIEDSIMESIKLQIKTNRYIYVQGDLLYDLKQIDYSKYKIGSLSSLEIQEYVLMLASMFTASTYRSYSAYKQNLSAVYLQQNISCRFYKTLLNILLDNKYISVYQNYMADNHSTKYILNEAYHSLKPHKYKVITNTVLEKIQKMRLKMFANMESNLIIRYYYRTLSNIYLPTEKDVLEWVKTHKNELFNGCKLLMKERPFEKDKQRDDVYYVKTDIVKYKHLLLDVENIHIPTESHGRIYTAFNIQTNWLKKCIADYNGMTVKDFSALHQNIIHSVFAPITGVENKYITHSKIDSWLQVKKGFGYKYNVKSVLKVKKENVSYFNEPISKLNRYKVNTYYIENAPYTMIKFREYIKDYSKGKMFKKVLAPTEGLLMTNIFYKFSINNINYAFYDFDGIFVYDENINKVEEIMNKEALNMNIYTTVK